MSRLIRYIWEKRLLKGAELHTQSGSPLRILDFGNCNEEGNVSYNSKIEVDGVTWAGSVILGNDKEAEATELNTILQVLLEDNSNERYTTGDIIHRLYLNMPPMLIKEFTEVIEQHTSRFQCAEAVLQTSSTNIQGILSRMLVEKLDEKAAIIERIYSACNKNWEETLFKTFIRSFGFGIQSKEFEEYANILDMQALGKHRDNLLQIEAVFFGQAGLLEPESIPHYYRDNAMSNSYYMELVREYRFLTTKFDLKSIGHETWNSGRITPHLRIARLAAIYHSQKFSLANIASCATTKELHDIICTCTQGYWYNHSCFGGTENYGNDRLKPRQSDVLIINAIAPVLYVYGKHRSDSRLCERAEELLYSLKPEDNSIIKRWREQVFEPQCAADTQALLQIWRRYCQANNCAECPLAFYHIQERLGAVIDR